MSISKRRSVAYDRNGVPVLNRPTLDDWAEEVLGAIAPDCLKTPMFSPVAEICQALKKHRGVTFEFGVDLGTIDDVRRLGTCDVTNRIIRIDREVAENEPRFRFTLAHEIAHFILHRRVRSADTRIGAFVDTRRTLATDRVESHNVVSLVEWQANYFAAALPMPRATLHEAVRQKQWQIGINRHLGEIWLDSQRGSQGDFKRILGHLCLTYQVSRSTMTIRLRELGILKRVPLEWENIRRIGDIGFPDVV